MDPAAIFRLDFGPGPWGPNFLLWAERLSCWAVRCEACDEWFFDGGRFNDSWTRHLLEVHPVRIPLGVR